MRAAREASAEASLGAPEEEQLGTEVLVAYAAQAGTVALDGRGQRNSPYTAALLAHLEQPLELNTMFRRVRGHVLEATGHGQQPWEYGALVGDHYLRTEVVVDRSLADSEETVFWESIRESSNPADFEAYLRRYPTGTYAPLARNRLRSPDPPEPATTLRDCPTCPELVVVPAVSFRTPLGRRGSVPSRPMRGGCTTWQETCGSGWRTAGIRTTRVHRGMARRG